MNPSTILRLPRVLERTGYSRSQLYLLVDRGLFTQQVKLSERTVGWPQFEVDLLCRARISGATDDILRQLVDKLHRERILHALGEPNGIPQMLASVRQSLIDVGAKLKGKPYRGVAKILESIVGQVDHAASEFDGLLLGGAQ